MSSIVCADPGRAASARPQTRRRPWVESGPEQVGEGVFRLPLPMPNPGLEAVNVYAVVDGDRLLLVDAGWQCAETTEAMEESLASLGLRYSAIGRVLVTHIHRDHYSEAMTVRRRTGATVAVGEGERPNFEAVLDPDREQDFGYRRHLSGLGAHELVATMDLEDYGSGYAGDWEPPDTWLADGERIGLIDRELTVVATPGHTRGHCVYMDEGHGLVFTGDHVLPGITPSIGLQPATTDLPLREFLDSLQRLLDMPDGRLLPAHGPVGDSVHVRATELLSHHEDRLVKCAEALSREAGATAYRVAQQIPWTGRHRAYEELVQFDQMLAVGETAAHLDLLVERGGVTRESGAKGWRYVTV